MQRLTIFHLIKCNFLFSLSPGISVTQIIRPRLGLGIGWGTGKRNIGTINVGVLLGLNEELVSEYSIDSSYIIEPSNITSLYLTGSFFLSLGYTFTL